MDVGTLTPELVAALELAVPQYLARESFVDYCQLIDPDWIPARHLRYVCKHLEALERGEINRLLIAMHPRAGKSEIVRKYIAWSMGRGRGRFDVVIATASAQLAEQHSRAIINAMGDERYPFRDFHLTATAADLWSTSTGGVVRSVGVGSQLSGFGAKILVLDDLVKDAAEAYSPLVQKSIGDWMNTVAMTRLAPKAKVVAIGTRWSENDALGQILNGPDADRWTKVVLPAIALEDDPLGRAPGEALWPERYPLESFPTSLSSSQFQALYQGSPVPDGGSLFKREWFDERYAVVPEMEPPPTPEPLGFSNAGVGFAHVLRAPETYSQRHTITVQAIDTASKTNPGNDWTVITTFACDYRNYYLVDVVRRRVEFPDLVRLVIEEYCRHRPTHGIYIEEAGPSGIAISQALHRQTMLPVIPVRPEGNKVARASAITAIVEARKVKLPERAAWVPGFLDEMCAFPAGRHDDQVDSFTLGLASIRDAAIRETERRRRDVDFGRYAAAGFMGR